MTRLLMLVLALPFLTAATVGRSDERRAGEVTRLPAGRGLAAAATRCRTRSGVRRRDGREGPGVRGPRGPKPVLVFDSDGKFVRSWGDDHLKTGTGCGSTTTAMCGSPTSATTWC